MGRRVKVQGTRGVQLQLGRRQRWREEVLIRREWLVNVFFEKAESIEQITYSRVIWGVRRGAQPLARKAYLSLCPILSSDEVCWARGERR